MATSPRRHQPSFLKLLFRAVITLGKGLMNLGVFLSFLSLISFIRFASLVKLLTGGGNVLVWRK